MFSLYCQIYLASAHIFQDRIYIPRIDLHFIDRENDISGFDVQSACQGSWLHILYGDRNILDLLFGGIANVSFLIEESFGREKITGVLSLDAVFWNDHDRSGPRRKDHGEEYPC